MTDFGIFNVTFEVTTKGEIEFIDLTDRIQVIVAESGIRNGIVHVFAPHATGAIILTENEKRLMKDISSLLDAVAAKNHEYSHPSNAHSHLRSMLLPPDKTIPVINGHAKLGTWQSLIFVETDVYPRKREIIVQVMGER